MLKTLLLLVASCSIPIVLQSAFLKAFHPQAPSKTSPGQSADQSKGVLPPGQMEAASRILPPPPTYRFPNKTTYTYIAEWRLFDAGVATLHTEAAGNEQHVVATADAVGAIALLYHVHDRLESTLSPKSFCSLSLSKHTEEGFRRLDTEIHFDYAKRKGVLEEKNLKFKSSKHAENDIPDCVTDVISAMFYAASLQLQPGRQFTFPLNDGGKTVDVRIDVEAREEVKTPAGTYKTVRLQPQALSGPLKEKGKLWVWFSDDGNHVPVQMRAKMFWGTLNFKLQHIDQGK